MSLASWKAEFYPIEAKDCPADQAIEHSLRKWNGLRPEALARHALTVNRWGDLEGKDEGKVAELVAIDSGTCALCVHFNKRLDDSSCPNCPLASSRGGVPCDYEADAEESSPFTRWIHAPHDPEPMIAALEKALADAKATGASHD